ncbi:sulfatase [Halobaculum magnesiiphilum]|uniref:Sulfatase n=1 Tax=Halobaculum magnesiiphilum TaxID=1017351 RepID=A0A8T8WEE8_9EURY|nr:sulfatase [Halobaculum magnesiiphilum]QZP38247.1 sulfatase [Halobaculum magnesiiphilum]
MTNIVLVSVDCLRADRVYNHHRYTTPTLHKLQKESLIFDAAYATGPYTTESIPGLIAGQHSYNGWYYGNDVTWKAIGDGPTLASWLRDQGFETVATLTNPHLSRARNFDRGFNQFENLRLGDETDSTDDRDKGGLLQLGSLLYDIRSRMRNYDTVRNPYMLPVMVYRYLQTKQGWPTVDGETVVDNFTDQLEPLSDGFFAWTHLMDLHAPLRPSTVRAGGLSAVTSTYGQLQCDAARAARVHEPRYDTMYDSALRYVDERIGDVIDHLQRTGVWDDTVLVVTGDHGEVLFDRNDVYGHPPHHLYDELLHVPLIVRTPDDRAGRISTPVSLAWLHEILAVLCDFEEGEFPATSGTTSLLTDSESSAPVVSDTLDRTGHTLAVRDNQRKILHHEPADENSQIDYDYTTRDIQFNYREDPRERATIQSDISPDLTALAHDLAIHPSELPSVQGEFGRDVEEQLRDLGYRA